MYWNEFDPLRRKAPVKLVRSYSVSIIMKFARIRAFSSPFTKMYIPTGKRKRKIKIMPFTDTVKEYTKNEKRIKSGVFVNVN